MASKLGISVAFTVVYMLTAEIFPTQMRATLLAMCSMIGRIGSMLAPQTTLLVRTFLFCYDFVTPHMRLNGSRSLSPRILLAIDSFVRHTQSNIGVNCGKGVGGWSPPKIKGQRPFPRYSV